MNTEEHTNNTGGESSPSIKKIILISAGVLVLIAVVVFFIQKNFSTIEVENDSVAEIAETKTTDAPAKTPVLATSAVVVMNDNDVSDDGTKTAMDYYRIPPECLSKTDKLECEIFYLQKNATLEKIDITDGARKSWLINGKPYSYQEYLKARDLYLKNHPKEVGYFVGNLTTSDGTLQSFNWVRGTRYEKIPWSK